MRAAQCFLRRRQAKNWGFERFLLYCWLNIMTLGNAANWGEGSKLVWRRPNIQKQRKPVNGSNFLESFGRVFKASSFHHRLLAGRWKHTVTNKATKPTNHDCVAVLYRFPSLSVKSSQNKGNQQKTFRKQICETKAQQFPRKAAAPFLASTSRTTVVIDEEQGTVKSFLPVI